jgi:hypothetical protein
MIDHSPTPAEAAFLSSIPGLASAEFATVRLTATMLSKSIIDAHEVVRVVLRQAKVVDYAQVEQGTKVVRPISLITPGGLSDRDGSFYRPATKDGDPRFWISGLAKDAREGELLVLGTLPGRVFALVLAGNSDVVRLRAAEFLGASGAIDPDFERDVADLSEALKSVKGRGWIAAIGSGAPTVGETLEAELGISRNSFRTPDFRGRIEIKSGRTGRSTLQTLFAKTPAWTPPISGTYDLVEHYGRESARRNRRELYCTVTRVQNTLGWALSLVPEEEKIVAMHQGAGVLNFPLAWLRTEFEAKHRATVFVKATSRRSGAGEELRYESAVLRVRGSFARYLAEIMESRGGLDLTASIKDGRARDHGYLWRVQRDRLPSLFSYERTILS